MQCRVRRCRGPHQPLEQPHTRWGAVSLHWDVPQLLVEKLDDYGWGEEQQAVKAACPRSLRHVRAAFEADCSFAFMRNATVLCEPTIASQAAAKSSTPAVLATPVAPAAPAAPAPAAPAPAPASAPPSPLRLFSSCSFPVPFVAGVHRRPVHGSSRLLAAAPDRSRPTGRRGRQGTSTTTEIIGMSSTQPQRFTLAADVWSF